MENINLTFTMTLHIKINTAQTIIQVSSSILSSRHSAGLMELKYKYLLTNIICC